MATSNPPWSAARNGFPGDTNAINQAAQADQFLASHGVTPIYSGSQIVTPTGGLAHFLWEYSLRSSDVDQPFTLPSGSTTIGRVTLPLKPLGNGADIRVSLCADNGSGAPGSVLASTLLPASWLTQFAAPLGLTDPSAGPLASAQFNTLRMGSIDTGNWTAPALGPGGAGGQAAFTASENFALFMGGMSSSGNAVANVTSIGYLGGESLSTGSPQPSLPQAAYLAACTCTLDTVVFLGGVLTNGTSTAAVYTASYNPATGQVGAWSAQASLPVALSNQSACAWDDTIYAIGGQSSTSPFPTVNSFYWAAVDNGQISSWNVGNPLPESVAYPVVGVIGNWLVVAGGQVGNETTWAATTSVYYAAIDSNGTPGAWQVGPSMPVATSAYDGGWDCAVTDSTLVIVGGGTTSGPIGSGTTSNATQVLTFDSNGPGTWTLTNYIDTVVSPVTAFPVGNGVWQAFVIAFSGTTFQAVQLMPVPTLSIPLPASGLTAGATYHVTLHQVGGDLNDYVELGVDYQPLPDSILTSPPGTNTWTVQPNNGYRVPMTVYDQTPGGQVLHTWEDSGARTATFVRSSSTGQLLGIAEQTTQPGGSCVSAVTAIDWSGITPIGTTQLA